jgi:general stress protein 26
MMLSAPAAESAARRHRAEELRHAMLTSIDPSGTPRTCPMPPEGADEDGTLWFLTTNTSPLAARLRATPAVLVIWGDPGTHDYLGVVGTATVLHDPAAAAALWSAAVRAWLPDGPDGPDVVVIRVAPDPVAGREPLPAPVALPRFLRAATGRTPTDAPPAQEP